MTIAEMRAPELRAWVDAMPAPNEHGFSSEPLPRCPECQTGADSIDVVGDHDRLSYVVVEPCGHQVVAMYSIEQP